MKSENCKEVTEIIREFDDNELNGDLKNLIKLFRTIMNKNKKYHRFTIRFGDCRAILYGKKLIS